MAVFKGFFLVILFCCNIDVLNGFHKAVNKDFDEILGSKIIGGNDLKWNDSSYIVSISHGMKGHHCCTGTIISIDPPKILTAAHCIAPCYIKWYTETVDVKIGCNDNVNNCDDGVIYKIKSFYMHSEWEYLTNDYDVAVLTLTEPINKPDNVKSISIELNDDSISTQNDEILKIIGYGQINTESSKVKLQESNLNYISNDKCVLALPDRNGYRDNISKRMMCIYDKNKSKCHGDSGSAIIKLDDNNNPIQIGIISHAVTDKGICQIQYPSVGVYIHENEMKQSIINAINTNNDDNKNEL